MTDHWLTIREATDLVNRLRLQQWEADRDRLGGCDQLAPFKPLSARTMRRRLYHADREAKRVGGHVLRWVSKYRVEVSAEALLRTLRTDPDLHEAAMSEMESRLSEFDRKLHALRKKVKSVESRVVRIESRTGGRDRMCTSVTFASRARDQGGGPTR